MPDRQIHVRIHDGSWAVFVAGRDVPESVHDRKVDAVDAARRVATELSAELVVFRLDGQPQ